MVPWKMISSSESETFCWLTVNFTGFCICAPTGSTRLARKAIKSAERFIPFLFF